MHCKGACMKPLLDVLMILDALEKEGSFAAASAKLYKTPSALSYTVHKLESDLNIQLLDRSGHRAKFTRTGKMLLEKGREVLHTVRELEKQAIKLHEGWENELVIGVDDTRHQVALQVAMAEHLIECDDHDTAQQIIIDGLKRQYDDRLLLPIPRLKTNNPEQLEKVLRQQIKNVGDRPLLWSTLGQSLMKHGEWQEASLAFRAALKQRPDAYDYAWLADALDRLHKPEEAAAMRRDGLMLTLQNNPPQ